MSTYIGNDLEDKLKILEMENASIKKYNEYHQVVHEINHMSDLHVESSFYKQSMKIDNYVKITELIDSSIGQSTVIQALEGKRPKLSNLNQTQNRRMYINFENSSHFICILNLNNPELIVFIAFKMTNIASENQEFVNSLIGSTNAKVNAKLITFYRTISGLTLSIAYGNESGRTFIAIANVGRISIPKPNSKFPSSRSTCTGLNEWLVISVMWSDEGNNLSNCWCDGEKLTTFMTGNVKGSDHCSLFSSPRFPKREKSGLLNNLLKLIQTQSHDLRDFLAFFTPCLIITHKLS